MVTTLFDADEGSELDRHLRAIARVVRLSGTPEEAQAFDYVESQLRGFGYAVARHESDALIGYPERASLELLAPHPGTVTANGYSLSPGTGDEGVVGELLAVDQGG